MIVAILVGSVGCGGGSSPPIEPVAGDGTCLYSGHLIDRLENFAAAVGRPISCAMVFNNAAPTWSDLVTPWFVVHRDPNFDWAGWKRADPERRLIISQSLVPDEAPPQWRHRGAAGEYDEYASMLATNLVAAGLGDSVIRLSHEANGSWTKDRLGPDSTQYPAWRETWRRFAQAMRSVPGAEFLFDWTVNPGVRPIQFDDYYPGDDVVDIIGIDIYDYWVEARLGPAPNDPQRRWDVRFAEPRGAGELIEFARTHDKPISIPEWGLAAPGDKGGAGDDPSFVENVARLIHDNRTVYHAYFENSDDILLSESPASLAVYRSAFGVAASTKARSGLGGSRPPATPS